MDQQKPKAGHTVSDVSEKSDNFELPQIPDGDVVAPAFHHSGPKASRWQRLKNWVGDHKKLSIFLAALAVLIVVGGGVGAYLWLNRPKPAPQPKAAAAAPAAPAPAPVKYFSPLTGLEVPNEATTKRQVTAIMIENSPDARPQSGLKDAGVVFEAIAEGGITRFAALYQEARPGLIGPVRSLRPYYLSWIAPFDPAIAHVGGSYNVLNEVRIPGKYKDIDQFFNGSYYWRATDRYAPHNVYTNFDKLDALNQSKGFVSSTFTGFPRKTDSPAAKPTAGAIDISISSATYNVHYDYDPTTNNYIRSEGGKKHTDREAGWIRPKVVVAIKVPTSLGWEDGYREQMTVIGSGEAYIFQDGTVEKATWSKAGQKDQMHFLNAAGQDIKFVPGQTWVTATPTEQTVSWQ